MHFSVTIWVQLTSVMGLISIACVFKIGLILFPFFNTISHFKSDSLKGLFSSNQIIPRQVQNKLANQCSPLSVLRMPLKVLPFQ